MKRNCDATSGVEGRGGGGGETKYVGSSRSCPQQNNNKNKNNNNNNNNNKSIWIKNTALQYFSYQKKVS